MADILRDWSSLPLEVRQLNCWFPWLARLRQNGKVAKVPAQRRGHALYPVRTDDASASLNFRAALEEVELGQASGIGLHLPPGMCVVDADDVLVAGDLAPEIRTLVEEAATWTELSPSRRGLHLWFHLPEDLRPCRSGSLELLTCGHYVTVTGDRLEGTNSVISPLPPALLERFVKRRPAVPPGASPAWVNSNSDGDVAHRLNFVIKRYPRFRQLFEEGDITKYDSASEADLALCQMIRQQIGPDPALIDLLFRRSALFRAKWLSGSYRDRTIALALRSGW